MSTFITFWNALILTKQILEIYFIGEQWIKWRFQSNNLNLKLLFIWKTNTLEIEMNEDLLLLHWDMFKTWTTSAKQSGLGSLIWADVRESLMQSSWEEHFSRDEELALGANIPREGSAEGLVFTRDNLVDDLLPGVINFLPFLILFIFWEPSLGADCGDFLPSFSSSGLG